MEACLNTVDKRMPATGHIGATTDLETVFSSSVAHDSSALLTAYPSRDFDNILKDFETLTPQPPKLISGKIFSNSR